MNLVLIIGVQAFGFLIFVAGVVLVNLIYYLLYRNEMNYFFLTEDSIVVKNEWRPKFVRKIPYIKIKSVGTYQILSNGPTLELVLTDGSIVSFNCSNVGGKKITSLVSELSKQISPDLPV
ncbi:MAG: hypothetical protein EBR30_11535 [Cytophagia bacterium]|nr:hypothetical protein [Cytophagia bacterium]